MSEPLNILLIAVDTLRAKQLTSYGYDRPTTPAADALAAEGVLFEDMVCSGIPTHPSFTTLYTGQHPMTHGIVAHGGDAVLDRRAPMLPEILLRAGWTTCAVDNLGSARPWFQRGYEFYIDPSRKRSLGLMVTAEQQNARAVEFLRHQGQEQFFLFVHYWDPHTPYLPPVSHRELFYDGDAKRASDPADRSLDELWQHPLGKAWRDTWFRSLGGRITDADYVRALYDASVRYADDGIARLLDELASLGLDERTLVVLMGDHGECLGEHGVWYDHHGLYEENIHVPFIMRAPGVLPAGERVERTVRTMDIAPTVLELAGLEAPDEMDGSSMVPLVDPTADTEYGGSDTVITAECTWQAKWSIRTPGHKFIRARSIDFYGSPELELYDRRADPAETTDIATTAPDVAEDLEAELEDWIAREVSRLGRTGDPVTEQGREKFGDRWAAAEAAG
ncbi:sulfatase [Candidatus Poribacteria bacterium]|nr:sulfatase [Candidatus Poribacteria bacterium]MBT5715214.1 sulfatase [Candidatus Poribacteria bacterium]MBT7096001.1 sulfatase [Candidatus Poribacteria bacterium]MBT7806111.1 sulfatase [Candidatus Poribacteria bacterium]